MYRIMLMIVALVIIVSVCCEDTDDHERSINDFVNSNGNRIYAEKINGVLNGRYVVWHADGNICSERLMIDGDVIWHRVWDDDGNLVSVKFDDMVIFISDYTIFDDHRMIGDIQK